MRLEPSIVPPWSTILHGPVDAIGMGICIFSPHYCHAIVHLEEGLCFHATYPECEWRPINAFEFEPHQLVEVYMPLHYFHNEDRHAMWQYCSTLAGTKYDSRELFVDHLAHILWGKLKPISDPNLRVCSSAVAGMYRTGGMPVMDEFDEFISPNDLSRSNRLQLVWSTDSRKGESDG